MEKIEENAAIKELSDLIASYAEEKHLTFTACSLPIVLGVLMRSTATEERYHEAAELSLDAHHALATCRMLIDLHPALETRDEDILLSSALCRILPQAIHMKDIAKELSDLYHLDPEVCRIVSIVHRRNDLNETAFKERIHRVQRDKFALMIVLASRGNIIERLCDLSIWNARSYIQETKSYYLPMCIYGKEHYPEILPVINTLYEKMKCLLEAAEILLSRYETREFELTSEIISLKEENALLKNMLKQLKEKA